MKLDERFAKEFVDGLNAVDNIESNTSNNKFKDFDRWFARRTGKSVAVTYLSSVTRQFRARVGAALMGSPDVIVVLAPESLISAPVHMERIEKVVRYVGNLRAVMGCIRHGDLWRVELVAGPEDSLVRAVLSAAFPRAESHSISQQEP